MDCGYGYQKGSDGSCMQMESWMSTSGCYQMSQTCYQQPPMTVTSTMTDTMTVTMTDVMTMTETMTSTVTVPTTVTETMTDLMTTTDF